MSFNNLKYIIEDLKIYTQRNNLMDNKISHEQALSIIKSLTNVIAKGSAKLVNFRHTYGGYRKYNKYFGEFMANVYIEGVKVKFDKINSTEKDGYPTPEGYYSLYMADICLYTSSHFENGLEVETNPYFIELDKLYFEFIEAIDKSIGLYAEGRQYWIDNSISDSKRNMFKLTRERKQKEYADKILTVLNKEE